MVDGVPGVCGAHVLRLVALACSVEADLVVTLTPSLVVLCVVDRTRWFAAAFCVPVP